MSRIIKDGKLPTRRMICEVCGCDFEYTERDVSRLYHPNGCNIDTGLRMAYNNYILCPGCNRPIVILPQKSEEVKNSDFMEDAQALAKQYGLKITKLEVE